MARRPAQPESDLPELKTTKVRVKELLTRAQDEAAHLLEAADEVADLQQLEQWTHEVERWDARTKFALESSLTGPWPEEFHQAATGSIYRQVGQSEDETFANRKEAVRRGIHVLTSIDERLEHLTEASEGVEPRPHSPGGSDVFIVHGHNRELRERVARLLERLELRPIILDEQPDGGRTIIEKFEDHALEVGFAVALLTPDDTVILPDGSTPTTPNRARQNVVLELGYFMGSLGRSRVVALCSSAVERPSDIHGLLYIDVGREGWELQLAREMARAELPVDLNRLL